ncbi:MAG TPA: hypothetical protein VFJ58_26945 [Armatimonadota bacterium]|nr:hypothetical protein [Armatimonadota bacterium]
MKITAAVIVITYPNGSDQYPIAMTLVAAHLFDGPSVRTFVALSG